jgi:ABC-type amino acid transport substrate-binding protein
MNFFYLFFIFICITGFLYKLFSWLKINTILSNISLAIIFSCIITKIIDKKTTNKKAISHDTMTVGVSPDYYPFTFMKENEISGFDIDLIKIIAEKLNKKILITALPFDTILPSLQTHVITVAISGLTGSPERAKNTLITIPYLHSNPLCIVSLKEHQINSVDQFENQSIIVNTGYTSESYVKNLNQNINIVHLKSIADALIALNNSKGIAFVTSYNSIKEIQNTQQGNSYTITVLPDTCELLSIFIHKEETQLLQEINTIIQELIDNKTIDTLCKNWNIA